MYFSPPNELPASRKQRDNLHPNANMKIIREIAKPLQLANATNRCTIFGLEEDLATIVCLLDFWQMWESPRKKHLTIIDLRVSEHPPNLHCKYPIC